MVDALMFSFRLASRRLEDSFSTCSSSFFSKPATAVLKSTPSGSSVSGSYSGSASTADAAG